MHVDCVHPLSVEVEFFSSRSLYPLVRVALERQLDDSATVSEVVGIALRECKRKSCVVTHVVEVIFQHLTTI